jgi:hypothetical protein
MCFVGASAAFACRHPPRQHDHTTMYIVTVAVISFLCAVLQPGACLFGRLSPIQVVGGEYDLVDLVQVFGQGESQEQGVLALVALL